MSKKTVIVTMCDKCQKELVGRLTFRTCPCCGKDICVECQTREDAKHKPRERKPRIVTASEIADALAPVAVTQLRAEGAVTAPDIISTFSVVTGQDGKPHTLKIGDAFISTWSLKVGVLKLLELKGLTEKDVEDAPESEGKRLLLNIFHPSKAEKEG